MFDRLFGAPPRKLSPENSAAIMRSLFGQCPICQDKMTGHDYCELASVFLEDVAKNEELAALINDAQWQRAMEFQDWHGSRDMREYYAVRCPKQTHLLLFTVVSLAEMLSDDFTESRESLAPSSSLTLAQTVGDKWTTL